MVRSSLTSTVQILVMPVYHTMAEVARSQAHWQLIWQRYFIPLNIIVNIFEKMMEYLPSKHN